MANCADAPKPSEGPSKDSLGGGLSLRLALDNKRLVVLVQAGCHLEKQFLTAGGLLDHLRGVLYHGLCVGQEVQGAQQEEEKGGRTGHTALWVESQAGKENYFKDFQSYKLKTKEIVYIRRGLNCLINCNTRVSSYHTNTR